MDGQTIYFVGTRDEIAHHAAPIVDSALAQQYPIRVLPPEDVVQQAVAGDLAIFYSEHFDRFRQACNELKKRNVATLYMIDGILEWRNAWENAVDEPACPWTMRPVLCHKVAAIGASQARVLKSWGNENKVEIVGIPRLAHLGPVASRPADRFRLLVMTAKWPGFDAHQNQITTDSLVDLKNWLDAHPTVDGKPVEVTWRLTRGLDQKIGVENRLTDLTGRELHSVLAQVDAVITTPSTAMLEAMLLGLPVALLDYHNAPKYVPAAWQITAPGQIGEVVTQLADPPAQRMTFQRRILSDVLFHSASTSAVDRMVQLVTSMLAAAAHSVGQHQALVFPDQILSDPEAAVRVLKHPDLFPDNTEFQNSNVTELQAELAHARREIKHLHREMAQLQSELDEAHSIFEQIHRHPVAGPIVRARQRMIDWFQARKERKAKRKTGKSIEMKGLTDSSAATPETR